MATTPIFPEPLSSSRSSANTVTMSKQDGYKLSESNSDLFTKLAEKLAEQLAQSAGSPPQGLSKVDTLLQNAHKLLSQRINAGDKLPGDDFLIEKDGTCYQAMLELTQTIDRALPVEEQLQRLLDRDIGVVLDWDKAALEMDEALLELFEGSAEVKEEIRAELVSRRAKHEDKLRRNKDKQEKERKDMDEFERRYG
jgi:hypothetical protein